MLIDFDIVTIIIGLAIYSGICLFIRCKYKPSRVYYIFSTIMFIYIMAVIKITIFPLVMIGLPSNITESINLIPFHNGFGRTDVLNFLMTLPFGMILPFVTKSKTIKSVSIKGFMLGCLVEILQLLEILFTDGFSVKIVDVNDVIFNLGGTVAGYLVMCLVSKLIDRPSKKGRVFMKYVFDVLDGVKLV